MGWLSVEVLGGGPTGSRSLEGPRVDVGSSPAAHVVVTGPGVAAHHVRLWLGATTVVAEDGAGGETIIVRGTSRQRLAAGQRAELEPGDVLELGEQGAARLAVRWDEGEPAQVVDVRPLAGLPAAVDDAARNREILLALDGIQRRLGERDSLDDVLAAVADAALTLVARATHATLCLRDESNDDDAGPRAFVPVTTRVRSAEGGPTAPSGPVPLTRSLLRRVVAERAAVLAADASGSGLSTESLIGARIHSTIGVPLWRGETLIGVIQVDSRGAPALFDHTDLSALAVLAGSASLAVANARLIRRLTLAEQRLDRENVYLKGRERSRSGGNEIIGKSPAILQLLALLDRVVDTRVSVLIEGETGTGKELVASALHHRSRRAAKLFVAQNCAALPENLLESELFGHKRGAFTGATEDRRGLFEVADGGTLFLDEIGELPLALQAKLLRALQEGEIRPLGASSSRRVDVRVVAATHRSLDDEVAAGRFREDLYYRLKVFPVRVPPLRERPTDVPLLAAHFLQRYVREFGKPVAGFAQETLETLAGYEWPGNVRELENEVQRLVIQAEPDGWLTPELLSPRVRRVESLVSRAQVARGTIREVVEQVERWYINETLREQDNNKTASAKVLGITREGLHKKMRQLGML